MAKRRAGQLRFRHARRTFHGGIDISGERGTPIVAVDEGVVLFSGRGPNGYGNMVMLDHGNGLTTLYAHNERNVVRQGARVRRGQTVAFMGDTGRAPERTCISRSISMGGSWTPCAGCDEGRQQLCRIVMKGHL